GGRAAGAATTIARTGGWASWRSAGDSRGWNRWPGDDALHAHRPGGFRGGTRRLVSVRPAGSGGGEVGPVCDRPKDRSGAGGRGGVTRGGARGGGGGAGGARRGAAGRAVRVRVGAPDACSAEACGRADGPVADWPYCGSAQEGVRVREGAGGRADGPVGCAG